MSDTTDISQMPTPGGGANSPASGTYGEAAALERLKQQLPQAQPPGPGAQQGAPIAPLPRTSGAPQPSGGALPDVLLAPTAQPDVPAATPLAVPAPNPMANAQTGRQQRLAYLDAVVRDPNSSEVTKEWAQNWINKMIQASAR